MGVNQRQHACGLYALRESADGRHTFEGHTAKRSDGFILLMHAQHGSSAVAFSTLEGLIAETKSCSVESTITTVRAKNRFVPKL